MLVLKKTNRLFLRQHDHFLTEFPKHLEAILTNNRLPNRKPLVRLFVGDSALICATHGGPGGEIGLIGNWWW